MKYAIPRPEFTTFHAMRKYLEARGYDEKLSKYAGEEFFVLTAQNKAGQQMGIVFCKNYLLGWQFFGIANPDPRNVSSRVGIKGKTTYSVEIELITPEEAYVLNDILLEF